LETRNAPRKITDFSDSGAKTNIFSLCVGVLKKNTNTKDARKHKSKKFLLTATHPIFN